MKLRAFDIPNDQSQLAPWLDEQLANYALPELVAELLAIHDLPAARPAAAEISIRDWLGTARQGFLQRGTAALSQSQRRDLLQRPWLLLNLQLELDESGGPYWNEVAQRSPEMAAALERGLRQWQSATPPASQRSERPAALSRRWIVTLGSVAALLLVGLFVWSRNTEPVAVAWGWNAADLFAGSPTAAEYLNRLADAAAKWRDQRPESKAAVAQRIREMRAGCQRLIERDHPPLSTEDQMALKQLCRKWLGEFEQTLGDLESDKLSPLAARHAMDQIVDRLATRLRALGAKEVSEMTPAMRERPKKIAVTDSPAGRSERGVRFQSVSTLW